MKCGPEIAAAGAQGKKPVRNAASGLSRQVPIGVPMTSHPLARVAPSLFVLIWATGFIVARVVAPYAEPFTSCSRVMRSPSWFWSRSWRSRGCRGPPTRGPGATAWSRASCCTVFISAGSSGRSSTGCRRAITALVAGLQPLVTALLALPLLGERVSPRRWLGIGLGFLGAVLVILPKLGFGAPPAALAAAILAMLSITLGTIWQKRTAGTLDMRVNAAIQYMGAAAVTTPMVLLTEQGHIELSWPLLGALAWAVLGLSIGAIGLLLYLIRHGAVTGVAALLYLVPPVAAVMAYLLFGETLSWIQVGGMACAAIGVAVASRN